MSNFLVTLKYSVALVGGFVTTLLGGWDVALKVLVLFVVLDYVVGVTAAFINKELNSEKGFVGIAKKVLLFIPVVVAYQVDLLIGQEILRNLAIFFYIANEGLSLIENAGRAGVPMFPAITEALEQLRGDEKNGN